MIVFNLLIIEGSACRKRRFLANALAVTRDHCQPTANATATTVPANTSYACATKATDTSVDYQGLIGSLYMYQQVYIYIYITWAFVGMPEF